MGCIMRLRDLEVMCCKVEPKTSPKDNQEYLKISILDLNDGDYFVLYSREMKFLAELKPMQKYSVDLELITNANGLSLALKKINSSK